MLEGLYIFVDDEFRRPIYADPDPDDLDAELWEAIVSRLAEVLEGELRSDGTVRLDQVRLSWRTLLRFGISFVCIVDEEVGAKDAEAYLVALSRTYMDEVDHPRRPEKEGVEDLVVGVIPPWDE